MKDDTPVAKKNNVGTSLGLATILIFGGSSVPNVSNLSWRSIETDHVVYSNSAPATYWLEENPYYRKRRIFKKFRFLKRGRSTPTVNHEAFTNHWG